MEKDFEGWLVPEEADDPQPPAAPKPGSNSERLKPKHEGGAPRETEEVESTDPNEGIFPEDDAAIDTAEMIRRLSKVLTWPKLTGEGLNQYVEELVGLPVEYVQEACNRARREQEDGKLPAPAWFRRVAFDLWDRARGIEQRKRSTDDDDPDSPKRHNPAPVQTKIARHLGKTTKETEEFLSYVGRIMLGLRLPVGFDPDDHSLNEVQRAFGSALRSAIRDRDIDKIRAVADEYEEYKRHKEQGLGVASAEGGEDSEGGDSANTDGP